MRTSNGMKKFFAKILPLIILIALFPAISFAQVYKIVFTTDPQSIAPNTLSSPITIQSQDSSGTEYKTLETIDLEFVSTSPTGQFLNGSGNEAMKYMSKNTANRTFYYQDSSEGNFTITVNAKGRETLESWSVSQPITVSSGAPQTPSGEVLGTSSEASLTNTSSSGGGSTTNVSSLNSQLEIIAGNDRVTSPGSPIWFQATVKKNTTSASLELNWSFGDGNVGVGPLVSHSYKYPGDYVVVLSSRAGDIFSVSRLKVKVVASEMSVSDQGQYLEISNNSNAEINLFNWKVENGGKGFIFQPNTIILPHSAIKLDKSLLTMKGYDNSLGTCLKNSLGEEVFAIAPTEKVDLIEVAKNIENIKKEVTVLQDKIPIASTVKSGVKEVGTKEAKTDLVEPPASVIDTENVVYEAPRQTSLISKLTNFIKRVFSK